MGLSKYKYNINFLKKDTEELYYFLGFVAADGYISDNEIEICVNKKDEYIIEKFRNLIVPDKPLYNIDKTNSVKLKLNIKSQIKQIKDFFGMVSNKKHAEIKFPKIPDKFVNHFIRGYFDGDGCIDTIKGYKGNKVYIGPRLRLLGNEIFLSSLNERTKDFVRHNTNSVYKKGKEDVYYLCYNFSTAKNLMNWIYKNATIYLERKKEKYEYIVNL